MSATQTVFGAIGKFCLIFIGSIIVGAMTALITAFLQKRQVSYSQENLRESEIVKKTSASQFEEEQTIASELSMIVMCPWVCYLIADGLQLSGIVAILTNGIFLNYYATPNVNRQSKQVIKIVIDSFAYITETMVFLFLGIGVFTFENQYKEMTYGTLFLALINFNLARLLNVGITSWFVNKSRSASTKIGSKQQFVMWIAGLRGAMAYALAMESSQNPIFVNPATGKNSGDVMLAVTIIYSLFTILGVSSLLNPIMQKCEVTAKASVSEEDDSRTADERELIKSVEKKKL